MLPGATVNLSIYYRDAGSNFVTVAATSVTNSPANFSSTTHFVDFTVQTAPVQLTDPWLGQNLGIRLLSTVDTNLEGGYWDVDNVRLSSRQYPILLNPARTNGQTQFTLRSEPGFRFEIFASSDPLLAASNWASLGTVTNTTGNVIVVDSTPALSQRFYRAQLLP
jgi:hypothetical protein